MSIKTIMRFHIPSVKMTIVKKKKRKKTTAGEDVEKRKFWTVLVGI
jgi:hypothetical protein